MRSNRPLYAAIILLIIWNIFSMLYYNDRLRSREAESSGTIINNVEVTGFSTDFTEVVEKAKSATVSIECNGSVSSGFLYRQNNNDTYVITTFHGIDGGSPVFVIFDSGYRKDAEIIGFDIFADIAVLRLDLPYIADTMMTGDSELLREGEFLIAIGTPDSLNYRGSVELAMVSDRLNTLSNSITFEGHSYDYYSYLIQLSTLMKEGYSGSALLNMAGEAVGVLIMKNDVASFALPINEVKLIADKLIAGEEVHRTMTGIRGSYIAEMANYERSNLNLPLEVTEGMYINRMKETALAYIAGVRTGDVLLSVNDVSLKDHVSLMNIEYTPAEEYVFRVLRNGETLEFTGRIDD